MAVRDNIPYGTKVRGVGRYSKAIPEGFVVAPQEYTNWDEVRVASINHTFYNVPTDLLDILWPTPRWV